MLTSSGLEGTTFARLLARSVVVQERTVIERSETLERNVGALEQLPARVGALELQLVQLRGEMHMEFSAVRGELASARDTLRVDIRGGDDQTRRQMDALHEDLVTRIREGDAETVRHMRVLHEDVVARIVTLQEGRRPRRKPRS